jgi:hypothetical protein
LQEVSVRYLLLILLLITLTTGDGLALTDSELITVTDGFDARRDQMLASQLTDPYPSYTDPNDLAELFTDWLETGSPFQGDINEDWQINLGDVAMLSKNWLDCTEPAKPGCTMTAQYP